MKQQEIRLMADDAQFVRIEEIETSENYGCLYYNDMEDTTTPWWEQGVYVDFEDIIAKERGEEDYDY